LGHFQRWHYPERRFEFATMDLRPRHRPSAWEVKITDEDSGANMISLTDKQAYAAMFYFVDIMHRKFGWEELGGLLGSMLLIDGIPLDAALVKDWKEAVQLVSDDICDDTTVFTLSEDEAHAAMWYFLNQMYEAKREKLDALVESMTLVDGIPSDRDLLDVWDKAIKCAQAGGKVDSLVVTKDGVSYEVHRGPETSGTK